MEDDSLDGLCYFSPRLLGYVCLKLNVLTQNGQFPEGSRFKSEANIAFIAHTGHVDDQFDLPGSDAWKS